MTCSFRAPLFDGDPKTNVTDWAIYFQDFLTLQRIGDDDAVLILRNQLAGIPRIWFESIPKDSAVSPTSLLSSRNDSGRCGSHLNSGPGNWHS